jgi:hypothetical protein
MVQRAQDEIIGGGFGGQIEPGGKGSVNGNGIF